MKMCKEHPAVRAYAKGVCRSCYYKAYYAQHRGWWKRYHKEHATERRAYAAKWQRENREQWENRRLKRTYGITLVDKKRMLAAQGKKCALPGCSTHINMSAHVDHDHGTGHVRGLLCSPCNTSLGHYEKLVARSSIKGLCIYLARGVLHIAKGGL